MYREHLMDHYKNPRHKHELSSVSVERFEKNPSCGDAVTVQFLVKDGVLSEVGFTGEGCAISLAGASMLLEELEGMTVDDALAFSREDMLELIGVPLTTMRVKCGLLALHAAKKALYEYRGEQ